MCITIEREVVIIRFANGFGGIRKLPGNRRRPWQVRLTKGWQIDGDRIKQIYSTLGYFETRSDALMALAEYNRSPYDLHSGQITFADIYNILWEQQFSKMGKSSVASYRAAYKKCETLHNMSLKSIKKAHMQEIMANTTNMSKASQNAIKVLLKAVFKYGLENDLVTKDYSAFVELTAAHKESTRKPFTDAEIKMLWRKLDYIVSPDSPGILSNPLIDTLLIMIYTGIRISELLDIKIEHININDRYIDLHGTKTRSARRFVPIHKDILPLITKRVALQDSEYLIPGNDNGRLSYSTYKYTFFNKAMDNLRINHNPHDCRHTFATYASRSRMDQLAIKRIMGHTSRDLTLDTYTHSFIADLVLEIDKFKIF